jgi:hypothetical protein
MIHITDLRRVLTLEIWNFRVEPGVLVKSGVRRMSVEQKT